MSGGFSPLYTRLVTVALVLSFLLIVLSSLMRLSNQGLGCDDWPDCYGRIDVVKYAGDLGSEAARSLHPAALTPPSLVERAHRGVASLLLLFVLALVFFAWRGRKRSSPGLALPLLILSVTVFLAVLGIVYGSPLLRPPVVLANLLGGMVLLALLWWLYLSRDHGRSPDERKARGLPRAWVLIALVLAVAQTTLGGWVSSNFSALACSSFPLCNGELWPEMDISSGFAIRRVLDVTVDGQVLVDQAATVAVQMVHRLGALVVFLLVGWLGLRALKLGGAVRSWGAAVLAILALQVALGIVTVLSASPLALVVTHNAVAALLWLALIALYHRLSHDIGEPLNASG